MSNSNPSRIGQVNQAGDVLALMLKVFAGEVLTTFERASLMRTLTTTRSISSGKSAQFPVTGIVAPRLHTPGDEILGQKINNNERVIDIEGLTIADVFLSNIDEWMNHYDYRSIVGTDIGQALAKLRDQNLIHTLLNAARVTTPNVKGVFAGDTLTSTAINAAFLTDGAVLAGGLYDAGVKFDERDVPQQDRFIIVRPVQHALLVKSDKLTDTRLNQLQTDLGGWVSGELKGVNAMPIYKTNNYTAVDDRTNTIQPAKRQKDYSTSAAVVGHRSAIGEVSLKDLTMESGYDMRRQGHLMLGKYMSGSDYLRPEAAFELQGSAPAA